MPKPDLICLHGALGAAQQLQAALQPLQSQYNLYFLDFPGHGKNAGTPIIIEDCVAAARDFIKSKNLAGTTIFGYSMGGYVALLLAKRQPELAGQIITLGTKLHWTPETAAKETQKLNPEMIEKKVPHYAKMLQSWHGKNWKTVLHETAHLMKNLGENPRLHSDVYQTILHPTLMLLAENDNMVSREETKHAAQMFPFGEYEMLQNSAHPIEKVDLALLQEKIAQLV